MSDLDFKFSVGDDEFTFINSGVTPTAALPQDVKSALLECFRNVAWKDTSGPNCYARLEAALNAVKITSITAVYTQTGTVYDTDSLDSLKADLVVTAYYDDGTTADVTSACTLSGTLTEGTSTITVTYQEKTATFEVTVAHDANIDFGTIVKGTYDANTTNGWYYKGVSADNRACINPIGIILEVGKTYQIDFTNTSYNYAYAVVKCLNDNVENLDFNVTSGVNKTIITGGVAGTDYQNVATSGGWGTAAKTYTATESNTFITLNFKKTSNGNMSATDLTNIQNALSIIEVV